MKRPSAAVGERPRKGDPHAQRTAFAAMLSRHLSDGIRPGGKSGIRWSNKEFAAALPSERAADGVMAERAVAYWCKGRFVPSAIEPILDALFGKEAGVPERGKLLMAWNRAVQETLDTAKPQAALGVWVGAGPGLRLDRGTLPADTKVARDPMQQQMQVLVSQQSLTLAKASDRPSNALTMKNLSNYAFAFGDLLGCEPQSMPTHLVKAYALLGQLGGVLETDDEVRADHSDAPLDAETRGKLRDLISLASVWLRGYPTVVGFDNREAKTRPSAEEVAAAPTLLRVFREQDCLSRDDYAVAVGFLAAMNIGPRGTAKAGGRALKAAMLALGTINNLIVTAARQVVAARTGVALADGGGAERGRRLGQALVAAEAQVRVFGVGMKADLRYGLDAVVDQAARPVEVVATINPVAVDRSIPSDVEAQAQAMILNGHLPPYAWNPRIHRLNFEATDLDSLDLLAGLNALKTLRLTRTNVTDLRPLSGLINLRNLNLAQTQVCDVAPLRYLVALESLNLNRTKVSDASPLSGLTRLRNLHLMDTSVSDVSPIANMKNLRDLDLGGTGVRNLSSLSGLTALAGLNLKHTRVTDLSQISNLATLKYLYLSGTPVRDIAPLSRLTALIGLDLSRTQTRKIAALSGMLALEHLDLAQTRVSDLSALAELRALKTLNLTGTRIDNVSPIAQLSNLTDLDLRYTALSEVSLLSGLSALRRLRLTGTKVEDTSALISNRNLVISRNRQVESSVT
jgi:hypothetical protein